MILPRNLLIAVTSAGQGGLIKPLGHHQLLLVLLLNGTYLKNCRLGGGFA
ncbi:hypothetical protein [Dulcicalothrix desertica]|nr:hypothetical protein [Dulcicalothrix desertica]